MRNAEPWITSSSAVLAAFVGGLLALVFRGVQSVPADPDLWGHTRFGLDHIASGQLARTDPFSFMTEGQAWVNHEWLTELVFGWAYLAGGAAGLFWLRAGLFTAIVALLFALCWSSWRHGTIMLLLAAGIVPLLGIFANVRPHTFTFLFLLVVLFAVEAYAQGRRRWINLLPVLMVLWVNLHGGFVVGLGLTGLGLLMLLVGWEGDAGVPSPRARAHLVGIGLLTAAATLCNPYHVGLYAYLFDALTLPREHVTEWMTLRGAQLVPYVLLTAVPTAMFVRARSIQHPTRSIFWLIASAAALFNARFLAFLLLFGALVIADQGGVLWHRLITGPRRTRLALTSSPVTVAGVAILIGVLAVPAGVDDLRRYRGRVWVDSAVYPVGATRFLQHHELGPHLALPFHWGEYAIWHLHPDYLVSQDGRYETVYPTAYIDRLLDAYYTGDLTRFTAGQAIDVLMVESDRALDRRVRVSDRWREVYRDRTATVYVPTDRQATEPRHPAATTAQLTRITFP